MLKLVNGVDGVRAESGGYGRSSFEFAHIKAPAVNETESVAQLQTTVRRQPRTPWDHHHPAHKKKYM